MGIFHYDQIAEWKKPQCDYVNQDLKFKGRIERDEWVKQAKALTRNAARKAACEQGALQNHQSRNKVATKKATVKKSAAKKTPAKKSVAKKTVVKKIPAAASDKVSGYGSGGVESIISVEAITREVAKMSEGVPSAEMLRKLAGDDAFVTIGKP